MNYSIPINVNEWVTKLETDTGWGDKEGAPDTLKAMLEEDYGEDLESMATLLPEVEAVTNGFSGCNVEDIFETLDHDDFSYSAKEAYLKYSTGYLVDEIYNGVDKAIPNVAIDDCEIIRVKLTSQGGVALVKVLEEES